MAGETDPREEAIKRIGEKRDFYRHLVSYVVVNVGLVIIWALTGREGSFWPVWVMLGWGIGVAIHAWNVFGQRPITEEDIRREMGRNRGDRSA